MIFHRLAAAALMAAGAVFGGAVPVQAQDACTLAWQDIAPTPDAPGYIPQGLAHDATGRLILGAYTKDIAPDTPAMRFYSLDPATPGAGWQLLRGDIGPLLHTSGIVPHAGRFYLVDYDSGLLARARIEGDLFTIEATFDTGRPKISAGAIARRGGTDYLLVSEFGLRGRYLWYPLAELAGAGEAVTPARETAAPSFVQGNLNHDGVLVETVNRLGRDLVRFRDAAAEGFPAIADARFAGPMVEDVTITGGRIYITDERDFRLYAAALPDACLGR